MFGSNTTGVEHQKPSADGHNDQGGSLSRHERHTKNLEGERSQRTMGKNELGKAIGHEGEARQSDRFRAFQNQSGKTTGERGEKI